ncbi:carbohydrate ABC transporter permease [Mycobacterium sp. NAZ190054]|uniref:carbohydrate ABC transporter permease n=1 Tax=Mycobacterium sp. NAZ190054 TaxID=1747766 RepID=UPI001E4C4A03|nr:sugar ABC transporter permease [Mycobacterium sp. NAZ190054]
MAPAMVMFFAVIAYPFVQSLAYGLFDESLLGDRSGDFVGLQHISDLLSSPDFWSVAWQTIVFVVISTVGALVLALALAIALNSKLRALALWRSSLLIPWLLPGVVVSFLWRWIFDTNYGLLNGVSAWLGGSGNTGWLDSPGFAMAAVIIAKIWHSFPWMAVLLLAALQGVPSEVHDAAAIDGAKGWQKQVYVVLPQIKAAIALTLLLEMIWGLQHFEIPYVMTGGGPVGSTTTLSIDLYKAAFSRFDLGEAGAIGILWTALMAVVVAVYLVYSARQEREARR